MPSWREHRSRSLRHPPVVDEVQAAVSGGFRNAGRQTGPSETLGGLGDPRSRSRRVSAAPFRHLRRTGRRTLARTTPEVPMSSLSTRPSPWLTAEEAAPQLATTAHNLRRLARLGRPPILTRRVGSRWLFSRADLGRFVERLQPSFPPDPEPAAPARTTRRPGQATEPLHTDGGLGGPSLEVEDQEFCVGDRVVMLRNRRVIGLLNGMRGTVSTLDTFCGAMTVSLQDGAQVVRPGGVPRSRPCEPRLRHDHPQGPRDDRRPGLRAWRRRPVPRGRLHRAAAGRGHPHISISPRRPCTKGCPLSHVSLAERTTAKIEAKWLAIERGEHLAIDHGQSLGRGLR